MSALTAALVAQLTGDDLDQLVDVLWPRLANRLAQQDNGAGWLRGADQIAGYIDCPRSRVYALVSAGRIPVEHDGSALVARRSDLDAWLRNGGGRRP